jgi:hypothetical protein
MFKKLSKKEQMKEKKGNTPFYFGVFLSGGEDP